LVGSKRVAPVRRASPSQDDVIRGSDNTEQTFQQKLQEIKKMRMSSTKSDESDKVVPKKSSNCKRSEDIPQTSR